MHPSPSLSLSFVLVVSVTLMLHVYWSGQIQEICSYERSVSFSTITTTIAYLFATSRTWADLIEWRMITHWSPCLKRFWSWSSKNILRTKFYELRTWDWYFQTCRKRVFETRSSRKRLSRKNCQVVWTCSSSAKRSTELDCHSSTIRLLSFGPHRHGARIEALLEDSIPTQSTLWKESETSPLKSCPSELSECDQISNRSCWRNCALSSTKQSLVFDRTVRSFQKSSDNECFTDDLRPDQLQIVEALIDLCRVTNICLEMRLHIRDNPYNSNGPSQRRYTVSACGHWSIFILANQTSVSPISDWSSIRRAIWNWLQLTWSTKTSLISPSQGLMRCSVASCPTWSSRRESDGLYVPQILQEVVGASMAEHFEHKLCESVYDETQFGQGWGWRRRLTLRVKEVESWNPEDMCVNREKKGLIFPLEDSFWQ